MRDIYRDLEERVPTHTLSSIMLYVERRVEPGDFLYAVLSNNLKMAFAHADSMNYESLGDIVKYLYNCVPSTCWGSPERVERWLSPDREQITE